MIHRILFTDHPTKQDINVARGKLNFMRMVKGESDSTYRKLLIKFNIAIRGKSLGDSHE